MSRIAGIEKTDSFFHPIAIASVSFLFIVLLLFIGVLNVRGLNETLEDYMESRALGMIRDVEVSAREYLGHIMTGGHLGMSPEIGLNLTDSMSMQETVALGLVEVARDVDGLEASGSLREDDLISLAGRERLAILAILDPDGEVIHSNRAVEKELIDFALPVLRGKAKVLVDVFRAPVPFEGVRAFCMKRERSSGAILIKLDMGGLHYRTEAVVLQKAVDDVVHEGGVAYFAVIDEKGRIMAGTGDLSRLSREEYLSHKRDKNRRQLRSDGFNLLEVTAPFHLGMESGRSGIVALSREDADQVLGRSKRVLFIAMTFVLLITLISMWFLYRSQKRHTKGMQSMERRLQQAERLSAMGRMAAGVAHEIRNPLNAISMAAQRLQRNNKIEIIPVIRDEIKRLNSIIEEFLQFSRTDKLDFQRLDLSALLGQILILIGDEAESGGIEIRKSLPGGPLPVMADKDKLKQAFLNITKNALEAMDKGGRVTLVVEEEGKGWWKIGISDTGEGIPGNKLQHIFDPDYTTKEKGLGLGLPIANEIIGGHGGKIVVNSRQGEGTTFDILLPRADKA
jgi:signal transduction histidine kinase